jgi:hypothetical protein
MVVAAAALTVVAATLAAGARANEPPHTAFTLDLPRPCVVGLCAPSLVYEPAEPAVVRVEVDWDHVGEPADGFVADAVATCAGVDTEAVDLPGVCALEGPVYRSEGTRSVAIRVTDPTGAVAFGMHAVTVVRDAGVDEGTNDPVETGSADEAYAARVCPPVRRDRYTCGPGWGRQTPGGGGKVSHKGWPKVTGVLWQIRDVRGGYTLVGAELNDELLGRHGSDRIRGNAGKDIIWGDWDPKNNNTWQRDLLDGGPGDDWIYSSHGRNTIAGGAGDDYIWAYYGRGTIDCGPGRGDTARIRLEPANQYRVRNCERIKNFCAHGSKPGNKGGCYKPGEKPRRG